jgi:hypothetical protein
MGFVLLLIAFVAISSRAGNALVSGCVSLIFGALLLILASALIG